jgi:hypothetical protein
MTERAPEKEVGCANRLRRAAAPPTRDDGERPRI